MARRCGGGEDIPGEPGGPGVPEGSARAVSRYRGDTVRWRRPRGRLGVAARRIGGGPCGQTAARRWPVWRRLWRAARADGGFRGSLRAGDDVTARVATVG